MASAMSKSRENENVGPTKKVSATPKLLGIEGVSKRYVVVDTDVDEEKCLLPEEKGFTSPPSSDAVNRVSALLTGAGLLGIPQSLRRRGGRSGLPGEMNASIAVTHTYRFVNNSASAALVTYSTLVGAMGGICTVANSTVRPFFSSIKLHTVTVWPAASASAPDTTQLFWQAGTSSQVPDDLRLRTVPQGVTVTGALTFAPPPTSLAGFWLVAAANLFTIQSPVGSVIDVHVSGRLSNVFTAPNQTIVSGTLGTVYYLSLDGAAIHTYNAVGLPTTA